MIVSITLLSLLYLLVSGVPTVRTENFQPFAPFGISGIAESAALLFFAFTGYARIATLAEEVKDPKTTIPNAVIITIVSAIVLYTAISIVAIGVIGTESMADNKSPLQTVSEALTTPGVQVVVTIGASTAMLGVLLSQILGISRMMLAMGRRHDLLPTFQRVHEKYRIPYLGILVTGGIILLLTVLGNFDFILRAAAFTILLYYSITNFAAMKQPKAEQLYGKVVPVLGLIGCILMAVSLPLDVIATGLVLLAVGFVIRFVIHRVYGDGSLNDQ